MDYKEYARIMRAMAVRDENGNIICSPELWERIATIIENIDTTDVVEVVRCVDCRRAIGKHPFFDERVCPILGVSVPEDFYCKYGERKESDG